MANIFREPIYVGVVAAMSTAVAIGAQGQVERSPALIRTEVQARHLLDQPKPANPLPAPYVHDVPNLSVYLHAPTPQYPFGVSDWPTPDAPVRSLIVDEILNQTVRLPQLPPQTPFPFGHVDELPKAPTRFPYGVMLRQEYLPGQQPPFTTEQFYKAPRLLSAPTEPVRNEILFPLPSAIPPFYKDVEWPLPARPVLKPETFLFYYIQNQTSPGFIQYDWPTPARVPFVRQDDPVPNRLLTLLPSVPLTVPFYKHRDFPLPAVLQRPGVQDPLNTNVFLPAPSGLPFYRHLEWPLPKAAKSLQPDHANDSIPLLTVPVLVPFYKHLEWPLPARTLHHPRWDAPGNNILAAPRFLIEYAVNSNQIVGPIAPTPETH